jgi:F1F0 ATPase subunit 2
MNEAQTAAFAWMVGALCGAFFFGGLWCTVRKGVASTQPGLWFSGSLFLRMGVALAGFYYVAGCQASMVAARLLLCLLGFVMARQMVAWLTRPLLKSAARSAQEGRDAPQSR